MVEWSRNLTQPQAPPELIDEMEQRIAGGIEDVRQRLDDARTALRESREQTGAQNTVERAAELARALETLEAQASAAAEEERSAAGSEQSGQPGQAEGNSQGGQPQGEGGRQSGAPNGGGSTFGGATPDGGDERQLRSGLRERIAEAEALRHELLQQGVDAAQLESVLSAMRDLERAAALSDPDALARLDRDVVDGAKEVEFALRRAVLAEHDDAPRVRGTGQVAEGFRKLVEEYYRALSREP